MNAFAPDMLLWSLVKVLFGLSFAMGIAGLLGWVERKQSAIMQDRIGANRADILGFTILGLFHPIADAIKMLTKEDIVPAAADRLLPDALLSLTARVGIAAIFWQSGRTKVDKK